MGPGTSLQTSDSRSAGMAAADGRMSTAERRMGALRAQLTAQSPQPRLVNEYVSRGYVILEPERLGVDPTVHARVVARQKTIMAEKRLRPFMQASSMACVPEVVDVINAPGVVRALDELCGARWAVVPFAHSAPFVSGTNDQHWHKDDNLPYNGRKARHHSAVQLELLYYPQVCRFRMPVVVADVPVAGVM